MKPEDRACLSARKARIEDRLDPTWQVERAEPVFSSAAPCYEMSARTGLRVRGISRRGPSCDRLHRDRHPEVRRPRRRRHRAPRPARAHEALHQGAGEARIEHHRRARRQPTQGMLEPGRAGYRRRAWRVHVPGGGRSAQRGSITLIDGQRFVELFLQHYDKLDPAWRARLQLRPVFVPAK